MVTVAHMILPGRGCMVSIEETCQYQHDGERNQYLHYVIALSALYREKLVV